MTNAEAESRIVRLRAHLARPGKSGDRQAFDQLIRLRIWLAGGDATRQRYYDMMLKEYYSPDKILAVSYGDNPIFAFRRKS